MSVLSVAGDDHLGGSDFDVQSQAQDISPQVCQLQKLLEPLATKIRRAQFLDSLDILQWCDLRMLQLLRSKLDSDLEDWLPFLLLKCESVHRSSGNRELPAKEQGDVQIADPSTAKATSSLRDGVACGMFSTHYPHFSNPPFLRRAVSSLIGLRVLFNLVCHLSTLPFFFWAPSFAVAKQVGSAAWRVFLVKETCESSGLHILAEDVKIRSDAKINSTNSPILHHGHD